MCHLFDNFSFLLGDKELSERLRKLLILNALKNCSFTKNALYLCIKSLGSYNSLGMVVNCYLKVGPKLITGTIEDW
jgi:hypothetical protein